jgi:hypothetical protein
LPCSYEEDNPVCYLKREWSAGASTLILILDGVIEVSSLGLRTQQILKNIPRHIAIVVSISLREHDAHPSRAFVITHGTHSTRFNPVHFHGVDCRAALACGRELDGAFHFIQVPGKPFPAAFQLY